MIELLWNPVGQYPKLLNVYIPYDLEISYTHEHTHTHTNSRETSTYQQKTCLRIF